MNNMKKIAAILLILFALKSISQNSFGDRRALFFNSYEDYQQNKSVDGVKLKEMSQYGSTVKIEKDGKTEEYKDSKIPYTWFCNNQGMLMRVFNGKVYYVIIEGAVTYYVKSIEAWTGYTYNTSTNEMRTEIMFIPNPNEIFKEYYSVTPTSEILVFKDKMFNEYLEKYGLKEQFEADKVKREMKDTVLDYKNKEWQKRVKYKKLINEKIKK